MRFELLIPLGLLGLIGIIALIIIYILRPNYQTKQIASTYIWKLSLKYKKKRPPTSKLRNILLFVLQTLIIACMAGVLAMPALTLKDTTDNSDVIAILDSSASMSAGFDGDSRFSRAIDELLDYSDEVFAGDGFFSVIIADDDPSYIAKRMPKNMKPQLEESLKEVREQGCYYGTADIDGALALSEEVLAENSSATICLFTDTQYEYVPDGIEIIQIATDDEWNAAILGATAELDADDNYQLTVEVACYGQDRTITVNVDVYGTDASDGATVNLTTPMTCDGDKAKKIIFRHGSGDQDGEDKNEDIHYVDIEDSKKFTRFDSIHVSIDNSDGADCFAADNSFEIYGGQKEVIKVQYASSDPNIFCSGALLTMKNAFVSQWDIRITEVKQGDKPATEGFDFYIFEHKMPEEIPTDGVVFLMDPDKAPVNANITLGETADLMGESVSLSPGVVHPVTDSLLSDNITVSKYTKMSMQAQFDVLMMCDGDPVLIAAKEGSRQLAVMAFSVHYSNIAVMPEFILLFTNMFSYYFPSTVSGYSFEIGQSVEVNGRGEKVEMDFNGVKTEITGFPYQFKADIPGTYTFSQQTYFEGKDALPRQIFVKIPREESNTQKTEVSLDAPYRAINGGMHIEDLLIYIAAAIVTLLFIEWILQSLESR